MEEIGRSSSLGQVNSTDPQQGTRPSTFSQPEAFRGPMSQNLISRIFRSSASTTATSSTTTPSIDTISSASPVKDKVAALKQVQTTMLVLIRNIAESITPNQTDRRSLGQLVTKLSGKLRAGDMTGASILGTNVTEKTVRRLLSVLDPVVLDTLSRPLGRKYTIAPQLKQVDGNYGRFGTLCQSLLAPEHRAAALADLAHTWERDAITYNFPVSGELKTAVASCLVDYLRHENWSDLIHPTEEQAFGVAACLVKEVLALALKETFVDPNRTITIRGKYDLPAPYCIGPRKTDDAGDLPLPDHVLEAIENITRSLPLGDSRRNMLANRLRAIPVPPDAPPCMYSRNEENDYFRNGTPDYPVIPPEDIAKFNDRLGDVREKIDNLCQVLLTGHPPAYPSQNPPPYSVGNAS